ncbi:MBL fold metallo-hydrolase [Hyalangium rubrum]|uniref:MBL fold metallo-hydrolase n=1 Tax=Hyalangium rubrum TaxID=3103134 RepID=A0ABU5H0R1_9BACT|nr:MBL fold metallo-hydrolase [Hyalangium sp. s54d21]MDY7226348.1 MBL fold metallo-hydrolase [Hyalangium sp. s54d21]
MRTLNRNPFTLRALRTAALSFALVAAGCEGDQGPKGDPGEQGPKGDSATVDPALSTPDKAFAGIGGKAAIQGLQNFALETAGQRYVFGEGFKPDDIVLGNTSDGNLVRYDVQGNRLSIRSQRTVNFLGFNAPQTFTEIINENLGYLEGSESIFGAPGGNLLPDRTAAIRRQQRLLNPHLILKDVAANPSSARDGGPAVLDGSLHQLLVVNDPVYPLSLYVNAQTGKLSKLVTLENDPLHRDVPVEVYYSGWEAAGSGGLLFPKQVAIAVDGHLLHAETRKSVTVNGALDSAVFAFPAAASPGYNADDASRGLANHQFLMSYASIGIPLEGLQTFIQPTKLTEGVWFLGGGSHNSMAIEQADGVVILEAPLYPERSTAIINWVKNEPSFENKRITHVLATHHHDDHSAGLRAFVAEGAKVVVHEVSAPHFRHIFRNPSTIRPDPLALKPTAPTPTLITVPAGGSVTLPDATHPVGAYSLETGHAADMLLFHVPSAKVAFSSDLFNPGQGGIGNGPKELYKSITQTHNLTVDTVAGGHGATAPIADLAALANP